MNIKQKSQNITKIIIEYKIHTKKKKERNKINERKKKLKKKKLELPLHQPFVNCAHQPSLNIHFNLKRLKFLLIIMKC